MKSNLLLLLGSLVVFAKNAHGANYFFSPWVSEPLAISVSFDQERKRYLSDDKVAIKSELYGIRAELFEFSLPYMSLAMAGSRYSIESFGPQELQGIAYRFELSDTVTTPVWHHFRFGSRLLYRYSVFDGDDDQFQSKLHGVEINAIAMAYLFDSIGLYFGAGLDGDSGRYTGNTVQHLSLKNTIGNFYQGGIDILLGHGGHVGLESRYRDYLTFSVYFQRRY